MTRDTRSIQIVDEEKVGEYVRSKVSYVVGEEERVTAYLLRSKDLMKPAPAILPLHQTVKYGKDEVVGLNGYPDFAYGHELAMRGYIVLALDHLTAGERIYPGKDSFDSGPFYERYPGWSMVGKNLEDSKSAIDVLCVLDDVDQDRIGVIGHSHGGHNAIFAAALIAPRPWLNISSYFDEAYGHQEFLAEVGTQLYQVYNLYKSPKAFGYYMHGNDHSFPKSARELAYGWLDRWLKE